MVIAGYCTIKKDATTGVGTEVHKFRGQDVRVLEFAVDGGAMVISPDANSIATFDKKDITRRFECSEWNNLYIMPPEYKSFMEQSCYAARCMQRKGGYNQMVKAIVIQASLAQGKFDDRILWAKQ